jgi:exopolysaccharide biosynthesis polyprenyl glycosylphosphotransferase
LFVLLSGCGLTLERYFVLKLLRYWRRRGRNYRNVIICGLGPQAQALARELRSRPELGIHTRCFADLDFDSQGRDERWENLRSALGLEMPTGRILQGVPAVAKALQDYAIDEVIFTDIVRVFARVEDLISICGEQGIRATIVADIFSIGLKNSEMSYFGGMPLIHFQTPPGTLWALSCKRLLDVVVSTLLLVLLLPLLPAFAVGVKTTKGPVFFKQRRMGLNGRIFWLLKFRSMVDGADRNQHSLRARNEMDGPTFKIAQDPRVTSFGRFLRRFSLDELPQLWNVFVGDMSLVGPRPPLPGEVSLYDRRSRRRLSMRPGLTCIWQVSGRNEIADFQDWVALDLAYIDNWSLVQDFWLLVRTVPAVLFGRGAH